MKPSNLEIKLDLMAIIDAAFYEFDDYVTECHESGDSPCLDVEVFVAEAIMRAGYRKVETDINDGGKTKDGDICRQNTPTNTPTCTNLHQLTPIDEMSAEIQEAVNGCASYWSGLIAEHLHEQGYRKQSEVIDEFILLLEDKIGYHFLENNSWLGEAIDQTRAEMLGG